MAAISNLPDLPRALEMTYFRDEKSLHIAKVSAVTEVVTSEKREIFDRVDSCKGLTWKNFEWWKNKFWRKYNVSHISGDIANFGYLGLEGAKGVSHAAALSHGVAQAVFGFGIAAGALNITAGISCMYEGIIAYRNGDKKKGILQIGFGVLFVFLGILMILKTVGAAGALAANPFIIPALFLIPTLFMAIDVIPRLFAIRNSSDQASQIKPDEILKSIEKGVATDRILKDLLNRLGVKLPDVGVNTDMLVKHLSKKMQEFQKNMGVLAAMDTFELIHLLLKKKNNANPQENLDIQINNKIKSLKENIARWNKILKVRFAQQVLNILAFIGGAIVLGTGSASRAGTMINAGTNFAMTGANFIPFVMDSFYHYERNGPVEVSKIDEREASRIAKGKIATFQLQENPAEKASDWKLPCAIL